MFLFVNTSVDGNKYKSERGPLIVRAQRYSMTEYAQ